VKITLLGEDALRLEATTGPLTIEAESPEHQYSPFHMLASGLATCVWSVLASWSEQAKLSATDLAIRVEWIFAENPHRVGRIALAIEWPSLPENRRAAAQRAAALCTVHATLSHPPEIAVEVAP
jgi:uncharacterized OsmC-like protein